MHVKIKLLIVIYICNGYSFVFLLYCTLCFIILLRFYLFIPLFISYASLLLHGEFKFLAEGRVINLSIRYNTAK